MPTCTVPMKDCSSKQLRRYGFDATRGTLAVMFVQGKDRDKTSQPYEYPCTPEMYAELEAADSKGNFFNTRIKGNTGMPHTKLVETPDERAQRKRTEEKTA